MKADRYLDLYENVDRLVKDFKAHNSLFIAFDFDNTIWDFHKVGDTYPKLKKLLKFLSGKDEFKLILFTGNEGEKLDQIIRSCEAMTIHPDYINSSPIMKTTKPYYNILLDDRAGLNDAYQTLVLTLNILNYNYED